MNHAKRAGSNTSDSTVESMAKGVVILIILLPFLGASIGLTVRLMCMIGGL